MKKIEYPKEIETELFAPDSAVLLAKYGLPKDVCYCKKCVISNQRPNSAIEIQNNAQTPKSTIHFNSDGVCDACIYSERKKSEIDWHERDVQLI